MAGLRDLRTCLRGLRIDAHDVRAAGRDFRETVERPVHVLDAVMDPITSARTDPDVCVTDR